MEFTVNVSYVLATYGRHADLHRFLGCFHLALEAHMQGGGGDHQYELIIVDQNPLGYLDDMLLAWTQKGLHIVHVRLPKPNQHEARQLGLEIARGSWVTFPDDDCYYQEDLIEQLSALIAKPQTPDVWVAYWAGEWQGSCPAELTAFQLNIKDMRNFKVPGCAMFVNFFKKQFLLEHGGFDPRLGLGLWFGACEDTDLLFAAITQAKEVWFAPQLRIHHHYADSPALTPKIYRDYQARARGTGAMYAKYDMPNKTILRGLLSPLFKPILPQQSWRAWWLGCHVFWGRLQGYVAWRFRHGRAAWL